ncbi:hypothetical protein F5888DRAFT_1635437 [Russula emetica]|nr:hypothetical protein F5888DRAFT_1635437 [Russula emetica]
MSNSFVSCRRSSVEGNAAPARLCFFLMVGSGVWVGRLRNASGARNVALQAGSSGQERKGNTATEFESHQGPTFPMKTMTDYVEKESFSCSRLGLSVHFSPGNLPSCVNLCGPGRELLAEQHMLMAINCLLYTGHTYFDFATVMWKRSDDVPAAQLRQIFWKLEGITKHEIPVTSSPSYSDDGEVAKTSSGPVSMACWLTAIANQLVVSPRISPMSTVITTWNRPEGPDSSSLKVRRNLSSGGHTVKQRGNQPDDATALLQKLWKLDWTGNMDAMIDDDGETVVYSGMLLQFKEQIVGRAWSCNGKETPSRKPRKSTKPDREWKLGWRRSRESEGCGERSGKGMWPRVRIPRGLGLPILFIPGNPPRFEQLPVQQQYMLR